MTTTLEKRTYSGLSKPTTVPAERTVAIVHTVPRPLSRLWTPHSRRTHGWEHRILRTEGFSVCNRALDHALAQIKSLSGADGESKSTLATLLRNVLEDASAYSTISIDDEQGVVAQWRAGRSYLVIEIGPASKSFVQTDANGDLLRNYVGDKALNAEMIRNALRVFTRNLNSLNPGWRRYFH